MTSLTFSRFVRPGGCSQKHPISHHRLQGSLPSSLAPTARTSHLWPPSTSSPITHLISCLITPLSSPLPHPDPAPLPPSRIDLEDGCRVRCEAWLSCGLAGADESERFGAWRALCRLEARRARNILRLPERRRDAGGRLRVPEHVRTGIRIHDCRPEHHFVPGRIRLRGLLRAEVHPPPTGKIWCYSYARSIIVTATNLCPPGSIGGWCNPPRAHFDLPMPAFLTLAQEQGGVAPVAYRRVRCAKKGGVRFTVGGNPYFLMILIHNVGGAGDIQSVKIKGPNTDWIMMFRNWGSLWTVRSKIDGALSFMLTLSDGKTLIIKNAVRAKFKFGQTWEGTKNY